MIQRPWDRRDWPENVTQTPALLFYTPSRGWGWGWGTWACSKSLLPSQPASQPPWRRQTGRLHEELWHRPVYTGEGGLYLHAGLEITKLGLQWMQSIIGFKSCAVCDLGWILLTHFETCLDCLELVGAIYGGCPPLGTDVLENHTAIGSNLFVLEFLALLWYTILGIRYGQLNFVNIYWFSGSSLCLAEYQYGATFVFRLLYIFNMFSYSP